MKRGILLLVLTASGAVPAGAQQTEYFEPPPPRPKFTLKWEALFRYDSIYHLRVRPDIERGRFEFRPEVFDARSSECIQMLAKYIADHPEIWNEDIGVD